MSFRTLHLSVALTCLGCVGGSATQNTSSAQTTSVANASDLSTTTVNNTPLVVDSNSGVSSRPRAFLTTRYRNPVSDQRADPGILHVGAKFYVFATNRGDGNIPAAESSDMVSWTASPNDALPTLPAWASPGLTWAPEVSEVNSNRFVMYFCARHTASQKQCVGTAVATQPLGPYVPTSGDPLACRTDLGGDIDPSPFVDEDGTRYVVFKNDGNCCGILTRLWLQKLEADGTTPRGSPVALLQTSQAWEGSLIEAPFLWRQTGRYYLFYSANYFGNGAYAIGYASSDSLTGPYTKFSGPWQASSNSGGTVIGPGGQNLINDDSGQTWLIYHTWRNAQYNDRTLSIAPVTWTLSGPEAALTFGQDANGPIIFAPEQQ